MCQHDPFLDVFVLASFGGGAPSGCSSRTGRCTSSSWCKTRSNQIEVANVTCFYQTAPLGLLTPELLNVFASSKRPQFLVFPCRTRARVHVSSPRDLIWARSTLHVCFAPIGQAFRCSRLGLRDDVAQLRCCSCCLKRACCCCRCTSRGCHCPSVNRFVKPRTLSCTGEAFCGVTLQRGRKDVTCPQEGRNALRERNVQGVHPSYALESDLGCAPCDLQEANCRLSG
mmetsp:Transcript_88652/g.185276  ORF Transcript_88652/g.185276 Transcript_88652/m.185276 type:complete len:227 (-) Transcript_88652:118-798(-)